MTTNREHLVEILRESGGSENLDEIYRKFLLLKTFDEIYSNDSLDNGEYINKSNTDKTKNFITKILEENSKSDLEEAHELFQKKEKDKKWELNVNFYKKEILNLDTKFFFLTTGHYEHRDIDYEIYTWNIHRNNKLKIGDLFIYRVPKKISHNKQFYFFGAGQIESIYYPDENDPQFQNEGDICAKLANTVHFNNPIYESELTPIDLGSKKDNWANTFDQYGIEEINLATFLFLLNKGTGKEFIYKEEDNVLQRKAHQKIIKKDFSVPDSEVKTNSSRGKWQNYFRNSIILPNYQFKCAITGITTKSLLTAAHILRWADHKDKRIDPQNGICLSKLVDQCFENNLIFIDDNYRLQIREETKKDKNLFEELRKYEGERISLPKNKEFYPNKNYLKIHRESQT